MEHLLNCHGEITFMISMLPFLPLVGPKIASYCNRFRSKKECNHDEGKCHE